jgi:uncharacterized membrane protein
MLRRYLASRSFPSSRLRSQRGSIIVPAAFAILVGIILLGSAQLGYVFYMKRELQNSADLAALSSVQVLNAISPARCPQATATAITSGIENMVTIAGPLTGSDFTTLECTRWDPAHWPIPTVDPTGRYIYSPSAAESLNAMHVTLQKTVPYIFPAIGGGSGATQVSAEAVATTLMPTAAFSVGSQLLQMGSPSPLTTILQLAGVPVNATLVDYRGLANVSITPSGLLQALGLSPATDLSVGSGGALVAARQVSVGQLLDATASIASNQGNSVAAAQITALKSLLGGAVNLSNFNLDLFGTTAGSGLFGMISTGTRDAALSAQVDALSLISTTIAIASAGHALTVATPAPLAGILTLQLGVVEPPSMGVGGVGTTAFDAQVRLFFSLDLSNTLLGSLLNVHLAGVVDLVDGLGTLKKIDCSQATRVATILVQSSLLQACIGNVTAANAFSTQQPCGAGQSNTALVTILGQPLLSLPPITITALAADPPDGGSTLIFPVDATHTLPYTLSTPPNPLAVGTTLDGLLSAALGAVFTPTSSSTVDPIATLASQYLEATKFTTGAQTGYYDVTSAMNAMQNGLVLSTGTTPPLGDWTITKGIPHPCGLLNTVTCYNDGSVWPTFYDNVTGTGMGTLDKILGAAVGLHNCSGLFSGLLGTYNSCVSTNLVSLLHLAPPGLLVPNGAIATPQCAIACQINRSTAGNLLQTSLDQLGGVLSSLLQTAAGIKLGVTDVTLSGLTCAKPRLVY